MVTRPRSELRSYTTNTSFQKRRVKQSCKAPAAYCYQVAQKLQVVKSTLQCTNTAKAVGRDAFSGIGSAKNSTGYLFWGGKFVANFS